MKKLSCLFLSAMLLVSLCASPALAANNIQGQIFPVDIPYEYPVLPGTPAWNELDSLEEKIAVCHVDEALLASMTTDALLDTVLNYPLLVNIYAFSSIEMGIESVSQYFAGLPLLLAREDAMECLSSYSETAPLSENDTEAIVRQTSAAVLARYMTNASPLISTPGGTPVESYYNLTWSDWGMTRAEAQENHNALAARYPKAAVVSGINPAYNCHSYAWYSTSTSNKYWINNPNAYMYDGSYTKQSSASAGNKACWSGSPYPVHSAIVRSVSGNTVTYISKWGFNGVFIHSANDCPYSGAIAYWGN